MDKMKKEGSSSSSINHLPYCDHQMAIEKIKRGQELVNRLKDVLGYAGTPEPVNELFVGIQNSLNNALSGLHSFSDMSGKSGEKGIKEADQASSKIRSRRIVDASKITPSPHYDGYEWRKYGEKQINGTKFERSYYRCTFSKELKCPATKTVQQVDETTDPPMYSVIYYNHHVCNHGINSNNNAPLLLNSTNVPKIEASLMSNTICEEMQNIHVNEQPLHDASSSSSSMVVEMMQEFILDSCFEADFGSRTFYEHD